MADDMDFESFEDLDNLDWSELEQDLQEVGGGDEGGGGAPAASADAGGGGAAPKAKPAGAKSSVDISYLLDVNLSLTVEVGKTNAYIDNVLSWDQGSIIELEKLVGEPLNLVINHKPVARGEVVVVNEKFALKITEILDPKDRLAFLT